VIKLNMHVKALVTTTYLYGTNRFLLHNIVKLCVLTSLLCNSECQTTSCSL